jgi:hypothetical protein
MIVSAGDGPYVGMFVTRIFDASVRSVTTVISYRTQYFG